MTPLPRLQITHLQQLEHSKEVSSRESPTKDRVIAQLGRLIVLVTQGHNWGSHCGAQIFRLPLEHKDMNFCPPIVSCLVLTHIM